MALEVRRWIESGVRLHLSVIADANEFPKDDGKEKLVLSVINRGSTPTTIRLFVAYAYKSLIHRVLNKSYFEAFVGNPTVQPLPFELGTNKSWMGILNYTDKLKMARGKGQLLVGVACTHSGKIFLKRVPTQTAQLPSKEID